MRYHDLIPLAIGTAFPLKKFICYYFDSEGNNGQFLLGT